METSFIKSESIKGIAGALGAFQGSMDKISKDATNPFFKSKYATLSNILDAIQQPLYEAGLTFTQFPVNEHGLTSLLIHMETGEYMQATYSMVPSKNDPQGIGSAITYMRRYALGAILGLNIDDDDDANAASTPAKEAKKDDDGRAWLNENTQQWTDAIKFLTNGGTIEKIETKYKLSKPNKAKLIEATLQTA